VITRADVEYLLEPLRRYLSVEKLEVSDVRTSWAGLRPLVAEPGKPPAETSRKDEILIGRAGVITIAGGKLTGYRPTALRTLERVERVLGRTLPVVGEGAPLPGGDFAGDLVPLARALESEHRLDSVTSMRIARLYGSEANDVARLGARRLAGGAPVIAGEVDWAVMHEGAATVEDVLYRRTRAALYEADARASIAAPIASRMAELLGWSEAQAGEQLARARARLDADLDFRDSES
jgi:glycerol-3-phosphate dehydrogenase